MIMFSSMIDILTNGHIHKNDRTLIFGTDRVMFVDFDGEVVYDNVFCITNDIYDTIILCMDPPKDVSKRVEFMFEDCIYKSKEKYMALLYEKYRVFLLWYEDYKSRGITDHYGFYTGNPENVILVKKCSVLKDKSMSSDSGNRVIYNNSCIKTYRDLRKILLDIPTVSYCLWIHDLHISYL